MKYLMTMTLNAVLMVSPVMMEITRVTVVLTTKIGFWVTLIRAILKIDHSEWKWGVLEIF